MNKNIWLLFFFFLWLISPLPARQAENGNPLFEEGKALFDAGNYANAVPVLEAAAIAFKEENQYVRQVEAIDLQARSQIFSGQTDKALVTYETAFQLALKVDAPQLVVNTAGAIYEIYSLRGQHNGKESYLRYVIYNTRLLENWNEYASALSTMGLHHHMLGQLDSARWYMEESLRIRESLDKPERLFLNYNHLAGLYRTLGEYDLSFEYHLRCIKILEEDKDSVQLVMEYRNVSRLFSNQKNLVRAEEYSRKALELANTLNLITYRAAALSSLAHIRQKQGEEEEALDYHQEALATYRKSKSQTGVVGELIALATIYEKRGLYENAERYLIEALNLANEKQIPGEMVSANLRLAKVKLKQKQFPETKQLLDTSKDLVLALNQHVYNNNYQQTLSRYYEATGQYQKAVVSARLAAQYKDSLFSVEQSEVIHELEERYERVKKDKEITQLNSENDLKDLRLVQSRRTNILALIGLILAGGIMVLLYYFNRMRRKANDKLAEKNMVIATSLSEKEVLLREIHHRVKNNLQVVSSLLRLQTKYIDDEKALDAIQEGRNRVKSMAMIHQNLYQEDNLTGISIDEYIEKLSNSLFHSYNIDSERIHLITDIDSLNLDVDTVIPLGLILNELLTNALKYAFPEEQEGEVAVRLKQEADYLMLEVKDNGVGIDTSLIEKKKAGGFGLKLIDTFADKLKAKLEIKRDNGTAVRILIHNYKMV